MNISLLAFFLLVASLIFLFFCKVNLVIVYKNGFKIFYKILFIRIKIYPFKKDKKSQSTLDGIKDAKNAFNTLKNYRELSRSIFGFYYRALRLKIIDFDLLVASKAPSSTALCYSFALQGISYLLKYAENNLIIQIPKDSCINIEADFIGTQPHFRTHFVIYTYLGPLVFTSILSLLKRIFAFCRRLYNGDFKAKRAN